MSKASVLLFPLIRRTGDIRRVAVRLLECSSAREVAHYQKLFASNLRSYAEWAGADLSELEGQLPLFWSAVMAESARLIEAKFSEGETA